LASFAAAPLKNPEIVQGFFFHDKSSGDTRSFVVAFWIVYRRIVEKPNRSLDVLGRLYKGYDVVNSDILVKEGQLERKRIQSLSCRRAHHRSIGRYAEGQGKQDAERVGNETGYKCTARISRSAHQRLTAVTGPGLTGII